MGGLNRRLASMIWWSGLAIYPAAALMLSLGAAAALSAAPGWGGRQGQAAPGVRLALEVFGLLSAVLAPAVGACWVVALWHIFRAGKMAFGAWSGLVYAWLAFVLSPWPG